MKDLQVWAVIALWAVAAGSSLAAGETTEVYSPGWGRMEVPVTWLDNEPVAVDKSYAEEHPDTVGLQAVAADIRNTVSDHESRIDRLENPAQSQGGDNQPATAPAGSEVSNMLTVEMFAVTLGALGLLGVLVWIAVLLGRRDENYGLSTLAQALNMGEGEVRGSATAPDGRSVAFRVSGVNAQAQATAAAGLNPPVPAPAPAPQPAAQGATPAQVAAAINALQGVGNGPTAANVAVVIAQGLAQGIDFANQGAIQTLVQNLVAQGLVT